MIAFGKIFDGWIKANECGSCDDPKKLTCSFCKRVFIAGAASRNAEIIALRAQITELLAKQEKPEK